MSSEYDINQKINARKKKAVLPCSEDVDIKLSTSFIQDCRDSKARGDALLYAALNKGNFLFNKTSQCWLRWIGHYWQEDIMDMAFSQIESVALEYLKEANRYGSLHKDASSKNETDQAKIYKNEREKFLTRVCRLRDNPGAPNCLSWANKVHDTNGDSLLAIEGKDIDTKPFLLATNNGVIDLRTGYFADGQFKDNLVKHVPHEFKGLEVKAPGWIKFLEQVFTLPDGSPDYELIDYLQRLFGYAITGNISEHVFPVFHGEGRNGKGTLVEMIGYVMGTLAQPIRAEMLLDQKFSKSSSGPSPDIMGLKGLRIAFASETDEGRRFSSSQIKWYTGGDELIGRYPHDTKETRFEPTHLLCLLTNNLPHVPGDDYAFWQRLHLIPFNNRFVDKPKKDDPNEKPRERDLKEKLKKEAPGIIAWLVNGCLKWQVEGLNPPQVVLSATDKYRFNEDMLAEFLKECCETDIGTKVRIPYKELYAAFDKWWNIYRSKFPPKQKKFGELMEKKKFKKEKSGGTVYFYGIDLKIDFINFTDETDE